MQRKSSHENIYYNGAVNVIGADVFPQTFPLHWHNHVEIAVWPENPDEDNNKKAFKGRDIEEDVHAGKDVDIGEDMFTGEDADKDMDADSDEEKLPVLQVNQTACRMGPGDILFIWPGEMHEIVENMSGRLIGLQFPVTLFDELSDFKPFFHFFRNYHRVSSAKEPELARRIMAHIRRMLSALESGDTFSGVKTVICLYEMFMDFGTYIKDTVPEEANSGTGGEGKPFEKISTARTLEKISAACGYIIDNCERELTLESAAAYAGFSACYFSRIFKQFTNYNFVEYLALQRIKRAQMLLADPDKSVTEISYQAGFKSISTFNRVFRQYRGCSPSEYRKYYLR